MDMDGELNEAGEALSAALAERSPHRPAAGLRDRVLAEVARRGRSRRRSTRASQLVVVVAALVLLLAGSLAWGAAQARALADERSLRQQLEAAAAKDEIVFDVVDARNVSRVTLHSTVDDSPTAAYGKVFTRPDMPYVVAMAGRLPPPPAGAEYHLYLDDRVIGSLVPNESGFGYFVYRADAVGISYRRARLVVEPPQSTTATGTLVLLWSAP